MESNDLTVNDILSMIERLEKEKEIQKNSIWFDSYKKYDTLESYDKSIENLKNILFYQFDYECD